MLGGAQEGGGHPQAHSPGDPPSGPPWLLHPLLGSGDGAGQEDVGTGSGHRGRGALFQDLQPREQVEGQGPPLLLALCLALWTPAHVSKSEGQPLRLTQPRAEVSTGDALRAGGLPHTILQLCSEHRIQLPPGFVTAPRGLSAPGVLCAAGQTCAHPPFLMGAEQA